MKVVKNPLFLIGVGSLLCAIILAIVSTVVNPSSALLKKVEKAMNKQDSKLLAECLQDDSVSKWNLESMTALLALARIQGEYEFEVLVADAEEGEEEDTKDIPTVVVIKSGDKVYRISAEEETTIEIDGKEYIYTGLE